MEGKTFTKTIYRAPEPVQEEFKGSGSWVTDLIGYLSDVRLHCWGMFDSYLDWLDRTMDDVFDGISFFDVYYHYPNEEENGVSNFVVFDFVYVVQRFFRVFSDW